MPGTDMTLPPGGAPRRAADREEIARLAAQAADFADAALRPATRRAYDSKWRHFTAWCEARGFTSAPADADVVLLYLTDLASTRSVSTLNQTLAAVNEAHRRAGHAAPTSARLDEVWTGIRHRMGNPPAKKRALVTADLRKVVQRLPPTLAGTRDRALLLVQFAAALRRSELVAIRLNDDSASARCEFRPAGLFITLVGSKTDSERRGQTIAVPHGKTKLCPVAALRQWLALSEISRGPIFRAIDRHGRLRPEALSPAAAADIVKRAVARAGFDPAKFAGHSLRSGFVTSAAEKGVDVRTIMKQTRHKKVETLIGYIQEADAFRDNAAGQVGL